MDEKATFRKNVLFDFLTNAEKATTAQEVMALLRQVSLDFGMDSFAISGIPLPGERIDPYVLLNAWPEEWFQRYADQNFVHVDPVIYRTRTSNVAFVWSDALKDSPLTRKARQVMNESSEFRMFDGYSVPIHGVGGLKAIVTFSGERVSLSQEDRGTLELISVYAHNRLRALMAENNGEDIVKRLNVTHREQEVLYWCAAGKTNWEIGSILGISAKTVQHEIAKLQQKLNTISRTQLIAEAFRLGILH